MIRRWDAWFDQDVLVLRRFRLLPWPRADVRRIPLGLVRRLEAPGADDRRKRRAYVTVVDPALPDRVDTHHVRFRVEPWRRVLSYLDSLAGGGASPAAAPPADADPVTTPPASEPPTQAAAAGGFPAPARPRLPVPAPRPRRAEARKGATPAAASPAKTRTAHPVIRATDGPRQVWLWNKGKSVHASLAPVGGATQHKLTPQELARLLLAGLPQTTPAIRALTGISDTAQAIERVRSWERTVELPAAAPTKRPVPHLSPSPGVAGPGGVREVSGGLPSLGKRRK